MKREFHVFDHDSLVWVMLDSMYRTILENYGGEDGELQVFYSVKGGGTITLPTGAELPADLPYMGSPFFAAHDDVRGDSAEDGEPAWAGSFKSADGKKTLSISNYGVNRMGIANFRFFLEAGGREFEGAAAVGDDPLEAEYMDLAFALDGDKIR